MKIATDKQLHFFAMAMLTAWLFLLLDSSALAIGIAFIIGLAKEFYYDYKLGFGTPDKFDMVANMAGILASYIVIIIGGML